MPAAKPQSFKKLAAWVNGMDKSAIPEKEDPNSSSAEEGARSSENSKDTKGLVGADSVEGGPTNSVHGRSDNMASSTGLEQNTASKAPPDKAKPSKTIEEESAKISSADLTDPAQLDAAFASLMKAAAELPLLVTQSVAAPAGASQNNTGRPIANLDKSAADKALAATVETFRKYGSDHADLIGAHLRGYWDTFNYLKNAAEAGQLDEMAAGGGEAPPPDAAAMMGGAGGGEAPPPDAAAMMGGAGGGEAPPDAGGGGGAPGPDDLAAAAAELGISPEQLMQLIELLKSKAQSEDGAGAMPPDVKAACDAVLTKAASVATTVRDHVASGKFRFKPAADGSPERKRRDSARQYFEELRRAGA